jgi:hypothetical protein
MPAMNFEGDMPLGLFRGEVTPPPTTLRRLARWSIRYAGFNTCRTYSFGDTGRAKSGVFGSFQIVQSRTHGYRFAAAYAKLAKPLRGSQFGVRPPFDQRGAPQSVTSAAIPCARRPFSTASNCVQS